MKVEDLRYKFNLMIEQQRPDLLNSVIGDIVLYLEEKEKKEIKMSSELRVGGRVVYHNSNGTAMPALVTAVWSETCINLVTVSIDDSKKDDYGRQVERYTSVPYKTNLPVHGNYFRFEEDEPNPYQAPQEV